MKITTKILTIFLFIIAIIPFVSASGCYYNPNGGVEGCRSVVTWGSYDSYIKGQTLLYANNNPGDRFMAWCPTQNGIPYIRSDSKLTTCGCPSEASFNSYLDPGECDTRTCSNCGNYVSYCKPEVPARCGDGIPFNTPGEECDDGNSNNNDGCLTNCKQAECGDGYIWTGHEQCEYDSQCNDGNTNTGDTCESCTCKHTQICQDECSFGETKCVGNEVYSCGDYDTDSCLEWGFKTDCAYHVEGQPYFKCEAGSSVQYKEVKEGICKDVSGNHDYCDSISQTVRVSSEYCGDSSCTEEELCIGDDIFYIKQCDGSCNQNTGKCTYGSDIKEKIEECGQDNCISHTNLDPFVFEYVEDNSGCNQNGEVYCGYDTQIFDVCIGDTVLQPYCTGKDHDLQEFDCNSLDGCYDFEFTECVLCDDDEGNCVATDCKRIGKEFREYSCGSGKCYYTVSVHDIDKDRIDDRCDNCIDVDKDGACDFDDDNCIGVYNPSQRDTDKDGKGDACDIDKDGDGYAAGYDCNDWNPDVHPFAIEIENNGIDDDCSTDTDDTIADTPHQIFYVDISMVDTVEAEENFVFIVSVTNQAEESIKDVQISASLPDLQIRENRYVGKMRQGASISKVFTFNIPKNAEGFNYLRVVVSNDQYKRVIYREIKIVTEE